MRTEVIAAPGNDVVSFGGHHRGIESFPVREYLRKLLLAGRPDTEQRYPRVFNPFARFVHHAPPHVCAARQRNIQFRADGKRRHVGLGKVSMRHPETYGAIARQRGEGKKSVLVASGRREPVGYQVIDMDSNMVFYIEADHARTGHRVKMSIDDPDADQARFTQNDGERRILDQKAFDTVNRILGCMRDHANRARAHLVEHEQPLLIGPGGDDVTIPRQPHCRVG